MKFFDYIKGDKVIWAIVLLLSIVSVLVVYTSIGALAFRYKAGNTMYYLVKHGLIVGVGIMIIYWLHKVKYVYFSRISQIGIFVAAPLLLFTLIKGVSAGDASRWLEIPGTGLTFQTSDFAKLMLIGYVARTLAIKQGKIKDFKEAFLPVIIPVIITCLLIFPANFSTAALLFLTCMVLMFIGRANLKHMLILIGSGLAFILIIGLVIWNWPDAIPRGKTWKARVENFSNGSSETNYQAEQAKIAIATGGIAGKGPGKSVQRNNLPQASSDFIYAILIEEYGFVASVIIVFLYLILFYRTVRIATRTEKTFASLLAVGLGFSLVFQAMINMAVAVNLFPVTGQPLPLVSMGGTSIWFTCIAIGIILSISVDTNSEKGGKVENA